MKSSKLLSISLARFADIVIIAVIAWLLAPEQALLEWHYTGSMLMAMMLTILVFPAFGVYGSWRGMKLLHLFKQLLWAWTTVIAMVITFYFLFKVGEQVSRYWLLMWWTLALLSMASVRAAVYALLGYFRRSGVNHKKVLLLGDSIHSANIKKRVLSQRNAGFEVVAELTLNDLAFLSNYSKEVDELWLLLPLSQATEIPPLLHQLNQCMVNVRWLPDDSELLTVWQSPKELLGMTALDLRVSPMSEPMNQLLKALEDRLLALIILVIIAPLMLVIAAGVKISSSGPVFYRQQRHGWNGKPFEVLKFRSMVVHREQDGQVTQAKLGDARITPFGAFLRRTSLDELPQFINVLKGDMSIVGPRPHAVAHNDYYSNQIDGYMLRHKMKPGITGWAQVNGWRGETDTLDKMKKRVEFDLWYIEHWSLWWDIKIIAKTLVKGFVHHNAR